DSSTISQINANKSNKTDSRFERVFNLAKTIYSNTNGAFDPTVGPLVNTWGFGFKNGNGIDSNTIDSLMQFVGFNKVMLDNHQTIKEKPEIIIDFSAIAKGFGVDEVAQLLQQKAIKNYMIEIGGEVVVSGKNKDELPWRLGINEPKEGSNKIFAIALLNKGGLATSGNYRNFRFENGQKYVHTINPKTGYGSKSKLLSASVVATNCATADAYATAFMVMGVKNAIATDNKIEEIDTYLIYLNDKNQIATYCSESLKDKIKVVVN
ncbi:MAG: FAD:protein FMN transferase, partial [Bacteroidia bacterium]